MHIALVRTEFIASRGGAERYAVNLARRWAGRGHRVSVVCAKAGAEDCRGVEIVKVSRPKVLGPYKHAWFATRAGKAAQKLGADAVLCLARAYPGDVLRLGDGLHSEWMKQRYGERALKLQRLNPRHAQLLKLEAELFKPGRFRHYVANSTLIRGLVMRQYGVDGGNISVIPNGVDFSRFNLDVLDTAAEVRRDQKIGARSPVILFAGMDLRRKGLAAVLAGYEEILRRAQGRVAAEQPLLVCLGDVRYTPDELQERYPHAAMRVRMLPPTSVMPYWYAAADVFVLPSLHDPSANAVTEALACGVPVVTSAQNGASQHIVDGKNGWVLKDRADAGEFADRVLDLLENRRDPADVRRQGGLISLEQNADRLLELLVSSRQEVAA